MSSFQEVRTPALLIDRDRLVRNCDAMRQKAERSKVIFRPHVKTHKCVEVALLQHDGQRGPITASTLAEVEFFAQNGFRDITYAVPLAPEKAEAAIALARRLERFNLLVDHPAAFDALERQARAAKVRPGLFLKVDCGYHRAGVDPNDPASVTLARRLASSDAVSFRGFLTHAGHSYHAASREELLRIAREESAVLTKFREAASLPAALRSVGSTPTMTALERFEDCDEVRPGNYVFFDAFQAGLGSCSLDECAATVLATVIGTYPAQGKLLVDAGSLALSREEGFDAKGYGIVCDDRMQTLPFDLTTMSQEHGQMFYRGEEASRVEFFDRLSIGARVRIVPNHSCITAAQFRTYYVTSGDAIVDEWTPVSGW